MEIDNFTSLKAEIHVIQNENKLKFYPELRLYKVPETITSEADIKTNLFSDNLVVVNYLKDTDYLNIRYQKNLLCFLFGFLHLCLLRGFNRSKEKFQMKIKFSFIFVFLIIIFILLIFFKSLFENKNYIPKK